MEGGRGGREGREREGMGEEERGRGKGGRERREEEGGGGNRYLLSPPVLSEEDAYHVEKN